MAKKKKKKVNPKQQQAEHRKAYLRKINGLAAQLGVDNFTASLTTTQLYNLFELRVRGITLLSESPDISPTVMREIRQFQGKMFRELKIELSKDGLALPVHEMLTCVMSLYYYLQLEEDTDHGTALQKQFVDLLHWIDEEQEMFHRLDDVLWFTTTQWCELTNRLYWLSHKFSVDGYHVSNELRLDAVRPEQRRVRLHGHTRTVYRVGWGIPSYGPDWISVKAALFDDPAAQGRDELPVYVQSHTLHRLEERLDCTARNQQQYHLYCSLSEPTVVKGPTGKWLIKYVLKELHLGYLVADIVDGILVVRTFLFITMDSTPEGHALQEGLGLAAVDKKYLIIDRLSTFMISDIGEHPDIKEHFLRAGCDDLFVFDPKTIVADRLLEVGDRIRDYLNTGVERQLPTVAVRNEVPQEAEV